MKGASTGYIHGTDPEEQRRLSRLNERLNAASLRATGIASGDRILDLGCGLGQLTRAMAAAAGEGGWALGIDFSSAQVAEAKRLAREANEESRIELWQGDAAAPPLREEEWGAFDVAHARFLLEHVSDPGGGPEHGARGPTGREDRARGRGPRHPEIVARAAGGRGDVAGLHSDLRPSRERPERRQEAHVAPQRRGGEPSLWYGMGVAEGIRATR